MSQIFVSHASRNNAEAIALCDWLTANGWDDVFLDVDPERGLKPGERWQAELKRAANRCELVVVGVSPAWAASKWCLTEFLLAKSMNKRIFGVIFEATPLGDLPIELTSEWQLADLCTGTRDYERVVTLPHTNQPATVRFSSDGLKRLHIGLSQSGLDPKYFPWPPDNDLDRSPYPGLKPLEAEDAGIFFGRDAQIVMGLDMLRGLRNAAPPRLLVVLGASGAGKSSYLRAGLLPRLARESQHFLPLPVIRPERAVMSGDAGFLSCIEKAFKGVGLPRSISAIRAAAAKGADAMAQLLLELVQPAPSHLSNQNSEPSSRPLLVFSIDQAEELFLPEGREEADSFLALLAALAPRQDLPVAVVFTIRSDKYEMLQAAPALAEFHQNTLSLAPMPHGEYAEIIRGPARKLQGKLKIDDGLVDALLNDIEQGGAKDALPLLAFTLEWLYREHGGDGALTLAEYRAFGGMQGAIEAAVDRALKAAGADPRLPSDRNAQLALLRRGLIPWLAGIDMETGLPRRRIARVSEIPDEARPFVDLLVEQRLFATDVRANGEKTVEPAHDALLRQWGIFNQWLREDTALLSVLDGVKRASRDWDANGRAHPWLVHGGRRLAAAERLKARTDLASSLEPTDHAYLAECYNRERAATARAASIRIGFAVLIFMLAVAGLAWLKHDALWSYWFWNHRMKASVLSSGAAQQRIDSSHGNPALTAFSDCRNGCPLMLIVPPGPFMMGNTGESPDSCVERNTNEAELFCENPPHKVEFRNAFAVSKTQITMSEWKMCVNDHGCRDSKDSVLADFPDAEGSWPMVYVTWEDCRAYTDWLSAKSGETYRLPSEAEREYIARAGTTTRFFFGDDEAPLQNYAWFAQNSENKLHPVGQKQPNPWGFLDVYGNAEDWVEDTLHSSYQGAPADGSAWTGVDKNHRKDSMRRRVVRGGTFNTDAGVLGSSTRDAGTLVRGYPTVGCRVVRELNQ